MKCKKSPFFDFKLAKFVIGSFVYIFCAISARIKKNIFFEIIFHIIQMCFSYKMRLIKKYSRFDPDNK